MFSCVNCRTVDMATNPQQVNVNKTGPTSPLSPPTPVIAVDEAGPNTPSVSLSAVATTNTNARTEDTSNNMRTPVGRGVPAVARPGSVSGNLPPRPGGMGPPASSGQLGHQSTSRLGVRSRGMDLLRAESPAALRYASPLRPQDRSKPPDSQANPAPISSSALGIASALTSNRSVSAQSLRPPSGRLRRMSFDNGARVEGRYVAGKLNGPATVTYPNGERYIGEMLVDKRHGEGRFFHADGSRFEGMWKNDKRSGPGKYVSSNGDKYEGMWENGFYHGFGVYISNTGAIYSGDWASGQQHGIGVYVRANGDKYEGNYHNDSRSGYGSFTYHLGDKYEGYFKRSHYAGFGLFTSRDNSSYVGDWYNGKKLGWGILTSKTGRKYKQKWVKGKLVDSVELVGEESYEEAKEELGILDYMSGLEEDRKRLAERLDDIDNEKQEFLKDWGKGLSIDTAGESIAIQSLKSPSSTSSLSATFPPMLNVDVPSDSTALSSAKSKSTSHLESDGVTEHIEEQEEQEEEKVKNQSDSNIPVETNWSRKGEEEEDEVPVRRKSAIQRMLGLGKDEKKERKKSIGTKPSGNSSEKKISILKGKKKSPTKNI